MESRVKKMDSFTKYSYISRSTPQKGEPSLLDRNIQLELFEEIKGLESIHSNNYDHILARYRKLREGIIASKVNPDEFILNVYQNSVDLSLKALNFLELYKGLEGLLLNIYPFVSSERKYEIQEYFLLYLITWTQSRTEFYKYFLLFNHNHDFALNVFKSIYTLGFYEFLNIYKTAKDNQRIFLNLKMDSIRNASLDILSKSFKFLELEYIRILWDLESKDQVMVELKKSKVNLRIERELILFKKVKI